MYSRFSKAFYFLTVVFFLVVFLYIYSASPEFVSYEVSDAGMPLKQITRDVFFYLTITVFLVYNLLLILPAKLIELQYTLRLKRLFPPGDAFRDQMLAWIYSFTGILNVSTVIIVFYIHSISNQNEIKSSEFSFFFYMVPVFFVLWVLGLFYILTKKIKQLRSGS
ncbi:DNA topoisomerase IV [Negadavirga shengliensis]|uniref:DNA topoisomerase IV n=1 Tax=Negadavirga shengliensis TaxID=1389218 RepID=A0ABV9T2I5_9BACT